MDRKKQTDQGRLIPRLLCLALFFLVGLILGQVVAFRMPESTGAELRRYLSAYLRLEERAALTASEILSVALLYIRYPLLALLLGFTSVGAFLICGATAAFGFFLSFSVSCFTAAFGRQGALLALSVLGIRSLVTLPCYFLLAATAMETSATLFRISRGQRLAFSVSGWRTRLILCAAVLTAGMCADLLLTPSLLRWSLDRMFS